MEAKKYIVWTVLVLVGLQLALTFGEINLEEGKVAAKDRHSRSIRYSQPRQQYIARRPHHGHHNRYEHRERESAQGYAAILG